MKVVVNVTNGVTILIFASYFDKITATPAWNSATKKPILPSLYSHYDKSNYPLSANANLG